MPAFFALTLALSAALLFSVQPFAARAALPILGGSPAVWNTSMVFFQAVVLAGYAGAHLLARYTSARVQAAAFVAAIALGVLGFPPSTPPADTSPPSQPLVWLIGYLTRQLALPCFALALTSPLLQRWFSRLCTNRREPYFLYAASNAGSLGALLAYPWLIEPRFDLDLQGRLWAGAFVFWGVLIGAAGFLQSRSQPVSIPSSPSSIPRDAEGSQPHADPTFASETRSIPAAGPVGVEVAAWIALAAVPASLLQGCTLFLTTDVASVPMLWVVPLALYLLTFVVAFDPRGTPAIRFAGRALPFMTVALMFVILRRATEPVAVLVGLHLAFLAMAGIVCHGRLVALRPAPERLTSFYLALALGGVLGGAFNAFIAPLIFRTIAEYPIAIALACAALPARVRTENSAHASKTPRAQRALVHLAWGAALACLVVTLGLVVPWITQSNTKVRDALCFGIPAIACCALMDWPRRFAVAVGSIFLAGLWLQGLWNHTQHVERNFFGVTRVTQDPVAGSHQIVHGNTIHGRQFLDPARRRDPQSYYHRAGPLGQVFKAFEQRLREAPRQPAAHPAHVGVIGLGAGSMAAYAEPGQYWRFFEIDPAVIRVARDPRWFSFLADSKARSTDIIEGDARLRLRDEPDGRFDLLVLDAFSSDSIPVHLMTREALELYRRKLSPDGWLLIHISNRYLALEPVLDALARDGKLIARTFDDTDDKGPPGKEPSHWVVMARTENALGLLGRRFLWVPTTGGNGLTPWTDRRAGVLEAFDWD